MSPPAQSSGAVTSAQHTVSTEAPASTQVFNNPELLQIILQQVPVEHLTALRPVARAWNDIILEINHIAPTAIGHGDENYTCLCTQACVHIPHYTHRFAIRGNPIFTSTHFYRTTTKDRNGQEVTPTTQRHYHGLKLKSWNDTSELDACANQFITDPPVSMVALGNLGFGYTRVRAVLRVSAGIRVGDLRDVLAKLYYANGRCDRSGRGGPSAWYACTSDIVRGTDGAGEREREGEDENGDGVHAEEMGLLSIAS